MDKLDAILIILIGAAALLLLAWVFYAVRTYKSFSREKHRLNTEIRRTHGKERRRFKRMRRRLRWAWLTFRYHG